MIKNDKRKVIISEFMKDVYLVCPKNLDNLLNNETLVLIDPFVYHGYGKIPENKYHQGVFDILFKEKKPLIVMGDIGIYEAIVKTALSYSETPRIFYQMEENTKDNQIESTLTKIFNKINPKKIILTGPHIENTQSEIEKYKNWDLKALSFPESQFLLLKDRYNVKLSSLLKNLDRKYNKSFIKIK